MQANIEEQQLADSTTLDKINFRLFEGNYLYTIGKYTDAFNCYNSIFPLADSDANAKTGSKRSIYNEEMAFACYQIARIMMRYDDYEQAYKHLMLAYTFDPATKYYQEDLAWFAINTGNYSLAVKLYDDLIKEYPYNIQFIYQQMQAYRISGKYKKAHKALDKIENLQTQTLLTITERVRIYNEEKKWNKSIEIIDAYALCHKDDIFALGLLKTSCYAEAGDIYNCKRTLTKLNQQNSENIQVMLALAEVENLTAKTISESSYLKAVLAQDFLSPQEINELARPMFARLIADSAVEKINEAFTLLNKQYSNDSTILLLKSDVEFAMRDTAAAIRTLYSILDISPKNEEVYQRIIQIESERGDNEAVKNIANLGYKNIANETWAYYRIMSIIIPFDTTDIDNKIIEIHKMLDLIAAPKLRGQMFSLLGDIQSQRNKKTDAIAMYDSCLVYTPNDVNALNNLSYFLATQTNEIDRAERLAQKAIRINAENENLLDTYAWILFLKKDYKLARFYFDKFLALCSEKNLNLGVEPLYHYGRILIESGETEKAAEIYTRALTLANTTEKNFNDTKIIEEMQQYINQF